MSNPTLTPRAAEEVKRVMAEQENSPLYLRMRVVGAGCSGFQTKLDLDTEYTERDELYVEQGINVIIDRRSILYIGGVSVDFINEPGKCGFSVNNPTVVKSTCGCGSAC